MNCVGGSDGNAGAGLVRFNRPCSRETDSLKGAPSERILTETAMFPAGRRTMRKGDVATVSLSHQGVRGLLGTGTHGSGEQCDDQGTDSQSVKALNTLFRLLTRPTDGIFLPLLRVK